MKFNTALLASLLLGLCLNAPAQANPKNKKATGAAVSKGKKVAKSKKVTLVQKAAGPAAAQLARSHESQLQAGCLDAQGLAQLHERMQMPPEPAPLSLQTQERVACWPYSAVITRPLVRDGLAVLLTPAGEQSQPEALIYFRSSSQAQASAVRWNYPAGHNGLRQLSTAGLRAEDGDLQDVPAHLMWEVELIARTMGQALKLAPGTHHLRLTLATEQTSGIEKIYAIELLESATLALVESAVWLERQGMPGAYFSLQGLDYERMLWQSPVQFSRISRGVGPSVVTIRRKVAVKTRKQGKPRTVVRTFRVRGQHIGIDFAAPTGTPVVAVADGEVLHADFNGGYGKLIIIDHGQGHHTYYAHLSAYASDIRPGTPVRRGETIGFVGSTGFSTGPHLHYEIRKQGQYIDPTLTQHKLQFWTLTEDEQPALLARLLMLQWAPSSLPALIEASRGAGAQ
jgi:murein DD-endopeptidase MepM/ murein hydrolase activator NlpD